MKKKLILLISIIFISSIISASLLAQENQIRVNVNVSSMQELKVEEAVNLSFEYPWQGMEDGKALIFENVGSLNLRSNVDWALNINSFEVYKGLEIYLRESNNDNARWQRLDLAAASLSGANGQRNISLDIKIVQSRTDYRLNSRNSRDSRLESNSEQRTLNLMYTLTEI